MLACQMHLDRERGLLRELTSRLCLELSVFAYWILLRVLVLAYPVESGETTMPLHHQMVEKAQLPSVPSSIQVYQQYLERHSDLAIHPEESLQTEVVALAALAQCHHRPARRLALAVAGA